MQTILLLAAVVKLCSASPILSERLKEYEPPKNFDESSQDNSVFDKILAVNEKSGEDAKLFQGDMVETKSLKEMIESRKRGAAVIYKDYLWPLKNGTYEIPYLIDSALSSSQNIILGAMREWMEKVPCLQFVKRSDQKGYLKFYSGDDCSSDVGYLGSEQLLSLGDGCVFHEVILHEIGHALGFMHEQARSDRDQYITIHWENIEPDNVDQFKTYPGETDDKSHGYDYGSIMHYGPKAFSKNGKDTITAKNGQSIGQEQELSAIDVAQMKTMYAPCGSGSKGQVKKWLQELRGKK